jgi:PAS domain S-box-containing protein
VVPESHQLGRSDGSARPVKPLRVLLLESSADDANRVVEALRADGLEPLTERIASLDALEGSLADEWDVLITSDDLPDGTLEDVLAAAYGGDPDLPVVAVSLSGGDRFALEALRSGASDLIDKAELERLAPAVRRAVADSSTRRDSRHASARLETSEMRFRAAMEGGFDAFFVFDREFDPARGKPGFRLVEMNSHGKAIFGGTRDELVGKFFDDFVKSNPERVAYFSERFHKVFELGTAFEEEYKVQTDAIDVRWLHYQVVPLASGVAVTARDITDRKRTEETLHLRERAIEAMTQGLVIIDATTDETPIAYVNPAFEELSGYSCEELVGRSPTLFDGPQTNPATAGALESAIAAGQPFTGEIYTYRKNGTGYWCSLRISPVYDERGTVTHFISIHADETRRRRFDEQFVHAQKMEAVGRLAGGIAHDFNNVLLVIRGYSHVLMTMAGEQGEGWAEAKEIETAATRASELVRQLLAFSRSQVIEASVLDVNHVVRETQKLLEPLLGQDFEVRTSLDTDAGSVMADPTQLEQAIVGFAVNACDAMPSGGSLLIRTQNVLVDDGTDDLPQLTPGAYTAISIEDTGLGMDADTRARVFEPFFSTKDASQATGLGLAAVYGMIKQSGGDITIASVPREGTSVTIYLPHAHELVLADMSFDEPEIAPSLEETVLLVEDNHEARVLVGRVLRESGYTVHEAALPDEALRLCDEVEGRIHLLLSDVVMPQMSGPKLAKIVVERRPDTRVMFVSGYIERPDDVDDVSAAAEFLQKPFTPAELIETVQRVLRSEPVQA